MLAEIRARLETLAKPPLKTVAGSIDIAALLDADRAPERNTLPAGYVVPLGFTAGAPRTGTMLINQTLAYRISVILAVAAQAERRGEKAIDEVEAVYRPVRDALVGFNPPDAGNEHTLGPMRSGAGRPVGLGGGVLFWAEEFFVDVNYRKE